MADKTEVLTDRFGRFHDYLRVSITDRCNFRCVYCMPAEGIACHQKEQVLTFEEIERLVRFFVKRGVRKVRVTGGEPTVRKGYLDLVANLAGIDGLDAVTMTTNGSCLARDASALKRVGLKSINVSLDTLRPERFESITRRTGLAHVQEGIEAALEVGLETKVNVVLMPGVNDDELVDFVELTRDRPLTVRFIEFMPFLDNGWKPSRVASSAELRSRLATNYRLTLVPGQPNDVAKEYTVEGFAGKTAFVSSVTESFCAGCNRIRLTADGQLKSCLFLPPNVSLRDLVRGGASDEELEAAVAECLRSKWRAHPSMQDWSQRDHLAMVQIGG